MGYRIAAKADLRDWDSHWEHKKDGWGSDIIINIAGAGSAKVSFGVFS